MKSPITLQIYKRILLGNLSRNRRTNNTGSCHWKLLLKFSTLLFFTSSFDAGAKITKRGCTNLKNTTVTTRILTTKTKTKIQIFHILIIWSLEKLPPIWYLCKGNRDTDKFEDLRQSVILLQQKIWIPSSSFIRQVTLLNHLLEKCLKHRQNGWYQLWCVQILSY